MDIGSVYVEVPLGTLICFVFLFFCFLNAPRTKSINAMRCMMLSCILWMSGDLFVRMEVYPGVGFWYGLSMIGLLMIPPFIYYFLFDVIDMKRQKLLIGFFVVSGLVGLINAFSGMFIIGSKTVTDATGVTSSAYSSSFAVYALIALEALFMLYVTVLAHKKIGDRLYLRAKLAPLLLGSICILVANAVEVASADKYPYSSFGGLVLAISVAYLMCRRHLFDISQRLWIGLNYMLAAAVVVVPIWLVSRVFDKFADATGFSYEQALLVMTGGITLWAVVAILSVITLSKRAEKSRSEKQFVWLQKVQEATLSIFDVEELCQKLLEVIPDLIKDVDVDIVIHNNSFDEYMCFGTNSESVLVGRSQEEIEEKYNGLMAEKNVETAPIHHEDVLQGYICLRSAKKLKMSYLELECVQQLAAHISVCLKNIQIYQTRYQMTIRDDLTGLYNRKYFKAYLEKKWERGKRGSLLYFDIDNFKLFNEIYGESCGDEILKWCGRVITETANERDTIFRMGSNEYLIYTEVEEKESLISLAKEIQGRLLEDDEAKPKVLQQITMSIGIAMCSYKVSGFDELLKHAERASFFAKQKGKNLIEIYGETDISREEKVKNMSAYDQVSSTVNALTAAINAKDSYTFGHSLHVSQYAVMLAKELGLDSNEVRIVKEAGLLHDIGKIGIPEHILQKQGRLTDEEYKIMKSHVTKSVEMIHFLPNMSYVIPAVISHHERYDGKGYPRGLAGEQIPLLGRILAVCDCYDAMVSKRSYKEAFSKEYATEELRKNKGTQFDPDLVDIFITLIPHIKDVEETNKAG